MMSRVCQFVLAVFLMTGVVLTSRAADEAAREADVATKMRTAFAGLAHSQAEVRDAARAELMGFERRYLPTFQRIVEQNSPLLPSQAAVLRQVVTHVYLAGEPYPANDSKGFLGVRMQATTVSQRTAVPAEGDLIERLPQTGVVIVERLPGFVGARTLLDGDVILAIAESPHVQFGSGMAFSNAIAEAGPGSTIHFHVLRRGRVVKVPVVLDPRPSAADNNDQAAMDALDQQRRQKADSYWRESFGPLVRDGVG